MVQNNKIKLGAHLSTSGGYHKAVESIYKKGGNCLQIFSSSPRTWASKKLDDKMVDKYLQEKNKFEIDPVYFHALYLVNLADNAATGEKSKKALIDELNICSRLEVKGSVVHTGSFKNKKSPESIRNEQNYPILIKNIKKILQETDKNSLLILENAGNRKIGEKIEQLAEIIEDVNNSRIRVCLDTCHLHAAGYDLNDKKKFDNFLISFDKIIGLEKLELIHMNDSRDELGALRDRHDNIGEGKVGINVFKNFLNDKRTKNIPFIIETPGFDKKGPDKKNLDILKSFIL